METLPSENFVNAVKQVALEQAETIGYSLKQPHALCRLMMVVLLDPKLKARAHVLANLLKNL